MIWRFWKLKNLIFIAFFSIFFSACATPEPIKVPIKCQVNPPIKPNCNDYAVEFDCGKAKGEYINALEKALQMCI